MKDKTSRVFELISAIILGLYCIVMIVYAQLHPINTKVNGMHSYTFPVAPLCDHAGLLRSSDRAEPHHRSQTEKDL